MDECRNELGLPKAFRPLVHLYALRILMKLGCHHHLLDDRRVSDPDVFHDLGISLPSPELPYRPDLLLVKLRRKLLDLDRRAPAAPNDATLTRNLHWLSGTLELTPVEADIVQFLAIVHHAPLVRTLLEKFTSLRTHEAHLVLSTVLDRPLEAISSALSFTSKLLRSGLVWSDLSNPWRFPQKLGLLEGVADQLTLPQTDPFHLFLSNFKRSVPATLGLQDFNHLGADLQVLVPYLADSLQNRRKGVNILIEGPPGTGKTELVRTLAQSLGSPLFEIASENRSGDPHNGRARFGAFQLAQGLLGGTPRPLVLFDEVEDVFRPLDEAPVRGTRGYHTTRKAWVNQLLQENPLPTFWVCNTIWGIDPAFLRRFDFVLKVEIPPRSVRYRILEQQTADLPISPTWVKRMAEHDHLSPAAIQQAAKVTRAVLGASPKLSAEEVISRVLGNNMEAMGAPRHPHDFAQTSIPYRLDVLNTDRDLAVVLEGVKRTGSVRACLYGYSGTGKSAFAHHLAEVLDRPLVVKRASDLQSKWVGETEKNLARMFEEATQESAVLLLDEADSFLMDRRRIQQSWEVSQVNELLTQMKAFAGIFIASTNLMETLDRAALRRFDLKIRFDYLAPKQRETLFRDCMGTLSLPVDVESLAVVSSMPRVTPGDFGNVMRQARLDTIPSGMAFAERLDQECQLKDGGPKRSIGF